MERLPHKPTLALVPPSESPPATAFDAGEPRVSGVLVRALADIVQQAGVSPERVLSALDTSFAGVLEVRVPLPEFAALFARAIQLTGDPALGLRCGLGARDASYDLMAPLVAHVPSLRHAVQEIRQFEGLMMEGAHLHLSEHMGRARLRCQVPRFDPAFERSCAELMVAGILRTLRAFGCTAADVLCVSFEHPCPAHYHAYADAFEGAERFAQPFTGIEFDARLLDRPHLHSNPELQMTLHAHAERTLARVATRRGLGDRLRVYLRTQRPSQMPTMAKAARELGMSVRSLRRRLCEEGESYRALTQGVLSECACRLLRDPALTVQEVADRLGFADATAFHRAFKRWTASTPTTYRAEATVSAEAPAMPRVCDLEAPLVGLA